MGQILHIVTKADDSTREKILSSQSELPGTDISIFKLTESNPDYAKLVEMIFAADSVAVW